MPNPFNITILDTSPIFQYFPSQDGPIDSSWNASFSGSSDSTWVPWTFGVGTSSHRTSLRGASVQLEWLGTAIYLYGDAHHLSYTIELDGTTNTTNVETSMPGLLFAKSGLTYGEHSLTLRVVQAIPTTSISSTIITVGMGETGTVIRNRTINTVTVPLTTDGIVLSGPWLEVDSYYSSGGPFVPRITTAANGSAISFPISSASAFYIIGHVNVNHGPYLVTLTPPSGHGPMRTFAYDCSSRWASVNTLKFLATGLNRALTYNVRVINGADLYYDQSQIVIFDTPRDPSFTPNLSAGAIAGTVIGLNLFLIILLFLFLLWRKRRSSQADDAMTLHDANATVTLPSNLQISTALIPSLPATHPEHPTNELRPLHSNSILSQTERNLSPSASTSIAIPHMSPPYLIARGLTQEDARFFNNLYALNVPAGDIATMMEALRAEREAAAKMNSLMEGSGPSRSAAIRVEPGIVNMVPPRYISKFGEL